MSTRPTLHDFIDDELLRAPMTLDLVVDAVIDRWRQRMPTRSRQDGDPVRVLQHKRGDLMDAALAHLRSAAQAELQRVLGGPAAGATAAAPPVTVRAALSLIDEDDVVVDIEIARCTETVKLKAEVELRELQTYTSALVNDPNVSRDTNPFRPEVFVRALWQGVQQLPLSRAVMAAFLREAAEPLADALRRTYAAAWQRLDEQGVTPATHRTIVVGGVGGMGGLSAMGSLGKGGLGGWASESARYRPPQDLNSLRDSMSAAFDALAAPPLPAMSPSLAAAPRPSGRATGATSPDPQLIELLARLFEEIQADVGLAPDTVALLQRLQPTALRVALRDPSLLDTYDHPLWRFIDQLTHDIAISAPALRLRLLGLGRNLIDHLASADARETQGFSWALARLDAARRHVQAQAITAAAADIDRLQRIANADVPLSTRTMPLDIGSLDTVPADLMTEPAAAQLAAAALRMAGGLAPGVELRAYLQGEWRALVALWQDDGHELALLREPATERLWALRQAALTRLRAEGLARPLRVRSLVRRAADKVLRSL